MATYVCPDRDVPGEENCRLCHGAGKILPDKLFGKFRDKMPCPRCRGTGNCPTCRGFAVIEAEGESGAMPRRARTGR